MENRAVSRLLGHERSITGKTQKEVAQKMMEAGGLWTERHLVFTNQLGDYLSYRGVYDCFKRIVRKIGCPNARFHDMKHTYAVNCIAPGDDNKGKNKENRLFGHSARHCGEIKKPNCNPA